MNQHHDRLFLTAMDYAERLGTLQGVVAGALIALERHPEASEVAASLKAGLGRSETSERLIPDSSIGMRAGEVG